MNEWDEDDEDAPKECPYCASVDLCEHLLLSVDTTFRRAKDGMLADAFDDRWFDKLEGIGEDDDECEPFEELLGEVEALCDAWAYVDFEGGPGLSSAVTVYYVESADRSVAALLKFLAGPTTG